MNLLRWPLLLVALATLLAGVALAVLGARFRRSFGASPEHALAATLACCLLVLCLGLIWPGVTGLRHTGAAVATLLIGVAMLGARRAPGAALLGCGYGAAWLAWWWWASVPE